MRKCFGLVIKRNYGQKVNCRNIFDFLKLKFGGKYNKIAIGDIIQKILNSNYTTYTSIMRKGVRIFSLSFNAFSFFLLNVALGNYPMMVHLRANFPLGRVYPFLARLAELGLPRVHDGYYLLHQNVHLAAAC